MYIAGKRRIKASPCWPNSTENNDINLFKNDGNENLTKILKEYFFFYGL